MGYLGILIFISFYMQSYCDNIFTMISECYGHPPISTNNVVMAQSAIHCAAFCESDTECLSCQYNQGLCYLNNDVYDSCTIPDTNSSLIYYQRGSPVCQHGGTMLGTGCKCINSYVGQYCERLMNDCSEGYLSTHYTLHQVYDIQPNTSTYSFPVKCEMKQGGRTLIQMHYSSAFSFNTSWSEYKHGFGSLTSDHWLGLEKIHLITTSAHFQLVVYMMLANGSSYHHYFTDFVVNDESDLYRFNFSVAFPHSVNPLGDSLTPLKGRGFSTYDNDNDRSAINCALKSRSGWWFDDCGPCNPNGELNPSSTDILMTTDYDAFWTNDLQYVVPTEVMMWLVYG